MSATPDVTNEPREVSLLESYRRIPGMFDELLADDGTVRPTWRPVFEAFEHMDGGARRALQDTASRLLSENGVTFVASDDADSTRRPWRLDLFPMLISADEWRVLETGLVQRARLLNEILVDLYGPQRILKEGVLPSAAVFGNAQFLRPCFNARVPGGLHLHLLAFDVARSPDGRWWVLSDRAEAPSGAGYALENRVVSSRCLPELFASQNVRRQASFFRAFNEHFMSLAKRDEPLVVFLSRGPSKRTYFEHAYLARYLGYNIVEGSDLTMRDDKLYLKTVAGLRQVDLLLRTVRSEMCDPLELRSDSLSGVPGLLQAARAGSVTLANALGSGLVESDAFLSFLPALSRYFLAEDLTIPSVATWWCGQEKERRYVLDNLDNLIVRRVSTTRSLLAGGQDGRVGLRATPAEREQLIDLIEHEGHDFVGQERLSSSAAPVWADERSLRPAPVVIRIYVAATASGYEVMPGGLARVSDGSDPRGAWLAEGDISKDTWVLADEPVEHFSLLALRQEQRQLRRGQRGLTSRAADNLFWLGRYTERAEVAVRLLRSLVIRLHGETGSTRPLVSPERIVSLLVAQKHMPTRRGKRAVQQGRDSVERELWSILFNPEAQDGLVSVLGNVRRTAEVARERLSFDAFRILSDLTGVPGSISFGPKRDTEAALRVLNRLIQYLAAFSGMVMENMTRGYGWRFLDMGRRTERVCALVDLVGELTVHGDPESDGGLDLLLELADSGMTYRSRYHSTPELPGVLDLLLSDETNPRSVLFQILSISDHLDVLPRPDEEGAMPVDRRITIRLAADLRLADPFQLAVAAKRSGIRARLNRLLRQVDLGVGDLSNHISQSFFSHSTPERIMGSRSGNGLGR